MSAAPFQCLVKIPQSNDFFAKSTHFYDSRKKSVLLERIVKFEIQMHGISNDFQNEFRADSPILRSSLKIQEIPYFKIILISLQN